MATVSTTACLVQTEVVMLSQQQYEPVPTSSVRVFFKESDVLFQYERIARINASEIGGCGSDIVAFCVQREQFIRTLKGKAGELGADGIILGAGGGAQLGAVAIRNLGVELHASLAVLPFRDLSVNDAYQYFGDGLSEAVLNALSKTGEIRVLGRASTFSFDRENRDISMIGEQLAVQYVLDGTVLVTGSRARVTASLLNAGDESIVWSETYERGIGEVTAAQLALPIVRGVEAGIARGAGEPLVAPTPEEPLVVPSTTSSTADNSYLLGRFFWNKRTAADLQTAASHFNDAVGTDSTFALAWSGLADSYILFPPYGVTTISAQEALARAEAAARRAVALEGTLAEARTSLALVLHAQWDWAAAQSEFTQATLLNPGYATARQWYAVFLAALDRLEESLAVVRYAEELDPLSPVIGGWVALVLDAMGAQDEAAEQYRKVLALHPNVDFLHRDAWLHSLRASDYESAALHLRRYLEITGSPMATRWPDGVQNEATREATLQEIADATAADYKMSTDLNMILGNEEAALRLLERLLVSPVDFGDSAGQLRVYVLDEDLRGSSRFRALLENMGLT